MLIDIILQMSNYWSVNATLQCNIFYTLSLPVYKFLGFGLLKMVSLYYLRKFNVCIKRPI